MLWTSAQIWTECGEVPSVVSASILILHQLLENICAIEMHHILGAISLDYAKTFFVLVAAILTSADILQSTCYRSTFGNPPIHGLERSPPV